MAQEEAPEEVQPPKKKGKLLIILGLAGVLLVALAIGAYFLLSSPAEGDAAAESEAHAEEEEAHPPIYEKLETFTVNLADQQSYLQTEVQLVLADAEVQQKIKERMPEVRDVLLRLLSSKTAEELSQLEGKDKLAEEISKQVNDVIGIKQASEGVKKVLFGAFIIQQ